MNYGSLRQDARRLSEQGRFGDSMMMHVNPIEVAALHSMTPGGLPRNPATGQPEAFGWVVPMFAAALGGTIGGARAKKRDQNVLSGILQGAGLGLTAGMGLGALAGGASAAGAAGGLSASQIAASKAAAAGAAKTGAAASGTAASGNIAGNIASQFAPKALEAQLASAMAPSGISPAAAITSGSPAGGNLLQAGLGPGTLPGGVPWSPEVINSSKIVMNQANPNVFPGAAPNPGSADMMKTGVGELLQGRGGEAFMKGAGDTLKGYGGDIKKGLGSMADNPMMTIGGALMLDQFMNDEDKEEYGEYDGPLAYGSWRHGGAG